MPGIYINYGLEANEIYNSENFKYGNQIKIIFSMKKKIKFLFFFFRLILDFSFFSLSETEFTFEILWFKVWVLGLYTVKNFGGKFFSKLKYSTKK